MLFAVVAAAVVAATQGSPLVLAVAGNADAPDAVPDPCRETGRGRLAELVGEQVAAGAALGVQGLGVCDLQGRPVPPPAPSAHLRRLSITAQAPAHSSLAAAACDRVAKRGANSDAPPRGHWWRGPWEAGDGCFWIATQTGHHWPAAGKGRGTQEKLGACWAPAPAQLESPGGRIIAGAN